jgi:hypothetical protein
MVPGGVTWCRQHRIAPADARPHKTPFEIEGSGGTDADPRVIDPSKSKELVVKAAPSCG